MKTLRALEKICNYSFSEIPFSEFDAVILVLLSYIDFEKIAPSYSESDNGKFLKLKDIDVSQKSLDYLCCRSLTDHKNKYLLYLMVNSKRYSDIKVTHVLDIQIQELCNSYFSCVFDLPDGTIFIAFRGTDRSLTGWKEDFMMSYIKETYCQLQAKKYVKTILKYYKKRRFYIGGHSKGGCLASKALINLDEKEFERLIYAYDFDGQGLSLENTNYEKNKSKYSKYVTQSDIIGMCFNEVKDLTIVSGRGPLGGHDLYDWNIDWNTKTVIRKKKRNYISKCKSLAFKMWLDDIDNDEREFFNRLIFETLDEKDVFSLVKYFFTKLGFRIVRIKKKYSLRERKHFKRMLHDYFKTYIFVCFHLRKLLKELPYEYK